MGTKLPPEKDAMYVFTNATPATPATAATTVPARALLRGDELARLGRISDVRKNQVTVWVELEDGRVLALARQDRVTLAN